MDEDNQKLLKDLRTKRGSVKSALTRTQTFMNNFDLRSQAISLIEVRHEGLPRISQNFDEIQSQIELIYDDVEENERERFEFEEKYYALKSEMIDIINADRSHNSSMNNNSTNTTGQRARLAPVSLPKFDGNIQEWESYFDCFKAMVHNEDIYPPAQKFSYLRSSLSGAALDVIKAIPMTENNYAVAIKRLQQRYENKSMVIQSHIRAILDCPQVESATSVELQSLHSTVVSHVAALEALGQPITYWDAWLVTILLKKIDHSSSHEWQLRRKNNDLPTYSELEEFLASRCIAYENSESWSGTKNNNKKNLNSTFVNKKVTLAATEVNSEKCPCCSSMHKLYTCKRFKELSQTDRFNIVRNARLCFNCLSPYHIAPACKSTSTCSRCKSKHNTLLHFEKTKQVESDGKINFAPSVEEQPTTSYNSDNQQLQFQACIATRSINSHAFLATAIVLVKDCHGTYRECRAILDSGSQLNFISKGLASLLRLPLKKTSLPVSGIGANQVHAASCGELTVRSRTTDYQLDLVCYVLPNIVSDLAPSPIPKAGWNIPDELSCQLADPYFYKQRSVDLLVGVGAFFDILGMERRALEASSVWLQESRFGWIVTGELKLTCLAGINLVQNPMMEDWNISLLEEDAKYGRSSKSNLRSLEEKEVVQHFQETASRNADGRFVLRLPMKQNVAKLGNSVTMATSRFISVERRLQRDPCLRAEYIKFMNEYLDMGHMQEVLNETEIPKDSFYLPHHAVMKTSSLTTKVRVVFDASAKSSSGMSLNDILMRGPTVQEDLFAILTRFRKHQYVITADIEKMFRQIAIAETDWDFQRILWRPDPSEVLRTYRLVTVTYGTTPASFMTTQCLIKLAEEASSRYPKAASVIMKDFYMDDLMTGCDTENDCCQLQQEISSILNSANLPLRKWCSNSQAVLRCISKEEQDPLFTLDIGDDDIVKSLGLCWKPNKDEFGFQVAPIPNRRRVTKRVLLSDLNKVFDPLGFLSPVLIKGKIFLQQLWQIKVEWDQPLSESIKDKWQSFHQQLEGLGSIGIPRRCKPCVSEQMEFHGFCDASQEAYGACIYVRSKGQDGQWCARLLCSRSRVAPLKSATIPRLELGGALLLAQLAAKVAFSWDVEVKTFHLWTDSMVVLGWINSQTSRLKTYVANRIEQILDVTITRQWRHVITSENPADVLSRGISAQELCNSDIWWSGPRWLGLEDKGWMQLNINLQEEELLPERKALKLALVGVEFSRDLTSVYSDWQKLMRATAWLAKFVKYLRRKMPEQQSRYLSVSDLKEAEGIILRRIQADEFHDELEALQKDLEVPRRSSLVALRPILENGLIRVGGRLQNADICEDQKHPIVLPAKHKITRLIFQDHHRLMLHCGPQSLLASVRRRFWPLKGRVMARTVVVKCVGCVRAKPRFSAPLMSPMPRLRVTAARPFTSTGVDFAGPLVIRSGMRRSPGKKAWIAIFVCFATRAIHLEAVEDLTSNAFIASLRRFMARRGKCSDIFSDNGTNFVGAKKELAAYLKNVDNVCAKDGVSWHFNPPSAPHFGGLWESAVKSAKHHLTRVVKDAKLSLSELTTLLCQIEACLNSRPMTPLSSDPRDTEALTPAHFLIGGPMFLHAEPDLTMEHSSSLKRWKYVQYLMQTFWLRWRSEYLPQLQVRGKWFTEKKGLSLNDVVIIKEDCTPPAKWKLGRVKELHPGKDGTVRVVTLQTANNKEVQRPVVKLCRLPVEEEEEEVETNGFQRGEDV